MCKHCEHSEHSEKDFNEAVKKFIKTLPYDIDIDEEYNKIQKKQSLLSRTQRDTIEAIVEYKKEHFGK